MWIVFCLDETKFLCVINMHVCSEFSDRIHAHVCTNADADKRVGTCQISQLTPSS